MLYFTDSKMCFFPTFSIYEIRTYLTINDVAEFNYKNIFSVAPKIMYLKIDGDLDLRKYNMTFTNHYIHFVWLPNI